MGLLSFIFKRANETPPPDSDYWYENIFGKASGRLVTFDSAMAAPPVYAAVTRIAKDIASLPCITYSRIDGEGKERATWLQSFRLLRRAPNPWMTAVDFFEMMTGHVLLRGNAYAVIGRDKAGRILSLIPLHPERVTPVMTIDPNGQPVLFYKWASARQGEVVYQQSDILHFKGFSSDGINGSSPISVAREAVGLSLGLEEYASKLFENYAKPGGILTHPGKLDQKARERLQESWQKMFSGSNNAHKTAVLEEGLDWKQVGLSSEDAQFLESRRFQLEEIARIFLIPPHMIGDLSRATFSNIEQQSLNYVTYTLMPWLRKFEEALTTALLPETSDDRYFVEFLVTALLRGDTKSRNETLAIQRQNGIINADEWRRIENMNPLPDGQGEAYLLPLNMVDARKAETMQDNESSDMEETERAQFAKCLEGIIRRYATKEQKALLTQANKSTDLAQYYRAFAQKNDADMLESCMPIVSLYAYRRGIENAKLEAFSPPALIALRQECESDIQPGQELRALTDKWHSQKPPTIARIILDHCDSLTEEKAI